MSLLALSFSPSIALSLSRTHSGFELVADQVLLASLFRLPGNIIVAPFDQAHFCRVRLSRIRALFLLSAQQLAFIPIRTFVIVSIRPLPD